MRQLVDQGHQRHLVSHQRPSQLMTIKKAEHSTSSSSSGGKMGRDSHLQRQIEFKKTPTFVALIMQQGKDLVITSQDNAVFAVHVWTKEIKPRSTLLSRWRSVSRFHNSMSVIKATYFTKGISCHRKEGYTIMAWSLMHSILQRSKALPKA